ncbi:MAG TPA: pyrrolo-quinoline quinone, partial [Sphingomicrobium sp.]|nr:pyrrolo-quinoline quinone [Sphingomicrobium sp.]
MSKSRNIRVALLIAAVLASSGCSLFKKGERPKTPVLGERISVLTSENDAQIDPATQALPFTLPAAAENAAWAESGGSASNSMGHVALGNAIQPAFNVQAGRGSSLTARLASPPIVANGHVYTIDTLGAVRSFDARTGGMLWASQTPNIKGNEAALYGGGIA